MVSAYSDDIILKSRSGFSPEEVLNKSIQRKTSHVFYEECNPRWISMAIPNDLWCQLLKNKSKRKMKTKGQNSKLKASFYFFIQCQCNIEKTIKHTNIHQQVAYFIHTVSNSLKHMKDRMVNFTVPQKLWPPQYIWRPNIHRPWPCCFLVYTSTQQWDHPISQTIFFSPKGALVIKVLLWTSAQLLLVTYNTEAKSSTF